MTFIDTVHLNKHRKLSKGERIVRNPVPRPPDTPKSRRHGAPPGPWPWTDFSDPRHEKHSDEPLESPVRDPHTEWRKYPESLFPNWKPSQVRRSKIEEAVKFRPQECVIRYVDITHKPPFAPQDRRIKRGEEDQLWKDIQSPRPPDVRARALFLDRPSGVVMQMLGTKYQIEPFFFSSSLNRIPSRYQEQDPAYPGDHITITLLFASVIDSEQTDGHKGSLLPISEYGDISIILEFLAVHMIRSPSGSTIVSFHSNDSRTTSAKHLQSRVVDAGLSVYWNNILRDTQDPTFVLLIYMWYALYAWDQALEQLYIYISSLEDQIITKFDTRPTKTMHTIHAHLLSYGSLLRDFQKSVQFVLDTPNPAGDFGGLERQRLEKECNNLLSEIDRLEMGREIHAKRLQNAMNMLFSSINLHDSDQMRRLTQVTVRDSRAMKQVSILTMIFLPASFVATVFGMNITALSSDPNIKGTLEHYFETAIPLTALTIWVIVASQTNAPGSRIDSRGWRRLAWPYSFLKKILWPPTATVDLEAQALE